ncbi:MAG: hypothetical protein ACLQUS_00230 [Desulfobaccales bacterium]
MSSAERDPESGVSVSDPAEEKVDQTGEKAEAAKRKLEIDVAITDAGPCMLQKRSYEDLRLERGNAWDKRLRSTADWLTYYPSAGSWGSRQRLAARKQH